MKNYSIKILSAICILMSVGPMPKEACEFNFVEDQNFKIESIKESCTFYYVPGNKTIGIKNN